MDATKINTLADLTNRMPADGMTGEMSEEDPGAYRVLDWHQHGVQVRARVVGPSGRDDLVTFYREGDRSTDMRIFRDYDAALAAHRAIDARDEA